MIRLIDANNWARIKLEGGDSVPDLYWEISNAAVSFPTFVVWDGEKSTKARKAIYPQYKEGRPPMSEDMREQFKFLQEMLRISPVTQIQVPFVEADDVIARLASKFHPDPVAIFSTDADLAAIKNAHPVPEKELPCKRQHLQLYKILVGDKSDNIKGIPGFGKKAWAALTESDLYALDGCFEGNHESCAIQHLMKVAPKRCHKWLMQTDAFDQLKVLLQVVQFMKVDDNSITEHMENGIYNPDAARGIFEQLLFEDA